MRTSVSKRNRTVPGLCSLVSRACVLWAGGKAKAVVYVEMSGFTVVLTPARGSPGICQSPQCFAFSCLFEFAERGPYCEKLLMQSLITVSNPAEITVFPLDILQ